MAEAVDLRFQAASGWASAELGIDGDLGTDTSESMSAGAFSPIFEASAVALGAQFGGQRVVGIEVVAQLSRSLAGPVVERMELLHAQGGADRGDGREWGATSTTIEQVFGAPDDMWSLPSMTLEQLLAGLVLRIEAFNGGSKLRTARIHDLVLRVYVTPAVAVKIVAWPPVGVRAHLWTVDDPVSRSASWPSGARRVSQALRRRRIVQLEVSARARGDVGAGYMEALRRILQGGVHLVRLVGYPINAGGPPLPDPERGSVPLLWRDDQVPLSWLDSGSELAWVDGTILDGVAGSIGNVPVLTVTGLPPSAQVARPGEFARVGGQAAMITAAAWSDESGVAVLRLTEPLPSGTVSIGESESAIFEVVEMGSTPRPVRGDWSYTWRFRQVYEDEIAGAPVEVDPWRSS